MNVDYKLLTAQAEGLIRDVKHNIANLANLSALLYETLPEINWAGFYLMEGGRLILGPFQGSPFFICSAASRRIVRITAS